MSQIGVGIGGELLLHIVRRNGRRETVRCGNTNTSTLRNNIAAALMGGSAAFAANMQIELSGILGVSNPSSIHVVKAPTRPGSANIVGLPAATATWPTNTNAFTVRNALVRSGPAGVGLELARVTGLSVTLNPGDQFTPEWRWTFTGLTSTYNTIAAILASGVGNVPQTPSNFTGTRVQYSINPRSGLAYTWVNYHAAPTRNQNVLEYPAPNAVLSATQARTVTFWRIARTSTTADLSSQLVSNVQPENTQVPAGARLTGSWKLEVL